MAEQTEQKQVKTKETVPIWQKKVTYLFVIIAILALILALSLWKDFRDNIAWVVSIILAVIIYIILTQKKKLTLYQVIDKLRVIESKRLGSNTFLDTTSQNCEGDVIGDDYYIHFKDSQILYRVDMFGNVLGREGKTLDEKRSEFESSKILSELALKRQTENRLQEELQKRGLTENE